MPSKSEMIPKPLHLPEPLCSRTIGSLKFAVPALPLAFLRDEPCGRTLPARALSRFFKMSEAAIRLFETKLELAEGSCGACGLDCLLTRLQTFIPVSYTPLTLPTTLRVVILVCRLLVKQHKALVVSR